MIHTGDCIEVMATMPADLVDAVVTDPPYGLEFMGKEWDTFGTGRKGNPMDPHGPTFQKGGSISLPPTPSYGRQKMPKCATCGKWKYNATRSSQCACESPVWLVDTWSYPRKFQQWCEGWAREAWRVTKPGGYLLAFGGTRTHHRLVCGLEDAGWIIRDELDWIYASGFPKGKANLKPAHEPVVLARKPGPLRPLGIDATRIPSESDTARKPSMVGDTSAPFGKGFEMGGNGSDLGRWPSNLILSDPELFDEPNPYVVGSGAVTTTGVPTEGTVATTNGIYGDGFRRSTNGGGDTGGYSRFFIVPKSSRADREPVVRGQLAPSENADWPQSLDGNDLRGAAPRENAHPTVKPVDLMRHLIRLVTPSGGTVLDPFLGSGSTAIAAELEGFPWIGIEKEPEYVAIAEARLNGTQRGLGLDVGAPTRKPPKLASQPTGRPHMSTSGMLGDFGSIRPRKTDEEPAA